MSHQRWSSLSLSTDAPRNLDTFASQCSRPRCHPHPTARSTLTPAEGACTRQTWKSGSADTNREPRITALALEVRCLCWPRMMATIIEKTTIAIWDAMNDSSGLDEDDESDFQQRDTSKSDARRMDTLTGPRRHTPCLGLSVFVTPPTPVSVLSRALQLFQLLWKRDVKVLLVDVWRRKDEKAWANEDEADVGALRLAERPIICSILR